MSDAVMSFDGMELPQPSAARVPASPLDAVPTRSHASLWIGGLGAALLHGVYAAGAYAVTQLPRTQDTMVLAPVTEMVEVEMVAAKAPEPVVPVAPEPEPVAKPEPEPEPVRVRAPVRRVAAVPARPVPAPEPEPAKAPAPAAVEPPPAAAMVAAALTAAPTADAPADAPTFVTGTGASFAGGASAIAGTSQRPVHAKAASALGVPDGRGVSLAPVDRSRAPMLAGGARWDCPFPSEAEDAGIDEAVVALRVQVDAYGRVAKVDVTKDPGDGFGREARRCALQKRWQAGLDRAGQSVAATSVVHVRFLR